MVATAAPGTRQLEVARGLGSNAVVGSICPPIVALPETSEGESRSPQANSNYDAALSQMNERVSELLPEAGRREQATGSPVGRLLVDRVAVIANAAARLFREAHLFTRA
jgi:hypothetical protein